MAGNPLAAVLDGLADGTIALDPGQRILFANAAAARLLRSPPSRLRGRRIDGIAGFGPGTPFGAAIAAAARGTAAHEASPDGLALTAMPSEKGLLLILSQGPAQQPEAAARIAGGMAHDFNNLLSIILGYAELLEDAPEPFTRHAARKMRSAAQRGSELTRRLRALSRPSQAEPRRVEVNRLLSGFVAPLRRVLGTAVAVELVPGPEPCPAVVDPVRLEAALMSLCRHARDAMPEGGRLTLETAPVAPGQDDDLKGRYIRITLSGTRAGTAGEAATPVFEPGGSGLDIARGFLEPSGGHARICPAPRPGTVVEVFIPRAEDDAEETPSGAKRQPTAGSDDLESDATPT